MSGSTTSGTAATTSHPATHQRTRFDSVFDVHDPTSTPRRRVIVIWAIWTIALAVLIRSHEMWRDELQAWAIARDSGSISVLLDNLRWEGHPPTWHLLLWPVSWISRSPVGLQVVSLAVASATTWLVLRHLPLSLTVRSLIMFGYYPVFELGTMARSYGLMLLLVVAVTVMACRERHSDVALVALLVALSGTTVLAVPLAGALALAIWGTRWWDSRQRRFLVMLGWVAAGSVVALLLARPPSDGGPRVELALDDTRSTKQAFATPARTLFPVSPPEQRFWNQTLLADGPNGLETVIGLVIFAAVGLAVRRSARALIAWILGAGGYVIMSMVAGLRVELRHSSVIFAAALAAVWFAARPRLDSPLSGRRPVALWIRLGAIVLLAGSVWAAAWASIVGLRTPFSGAAAAATWIDDRTDGDAVIMCSIAADSCSSVAIRLDVPAFTGVSDAHEPFTFVQYRRGWRRVLAAEDIPRAARDLATRTGSDVFVVTSRRFAPPGCDDPGTSASAQVENVWACRADQIDPGETGE